MNAMWIRYENVNCWNRFAYRGRSRQNSYFGLLFGVYEHSYERGAGVSFVNKSRSFNEFTMKIRIFGYRPPKTGFVSGVFPYRPL